MYYIWFSGFSNFVVYDEPTRPRQLSTVSGTGRLGHGYAPPAQFCFLPPAVTFDNQHCTTNVFSDAAQLYNPMIERSI